MTRSKLPIVSDSNTAAASACGHGGLTPVAPANAPSVHAEKSFGGNALLVTLGCAKNLVDSEIMLGALQSKGFRPVSDPQQADLIVVNTCAFLQSAVEEGVDRILELARYKETGRCRRLVVAGCMVERYRSDLEQSLPEVDRFISTDELLQVADEDDTAAATFDSARRPYFLYDESMPRLRSTLGHTSYVKIAEGCDRPCAFCIIPKIRGSFRSRPIESVVGEARDLVLDGVKELNLVAQDLTAYGSDLSGARIKRSMLSELLGRFGDLRAETSRDFWVRLLYAYPIGVDEMLIDQIRSSPVVCKYLDMPLQHISHAVLKRMNRPLGERGTRGLIEKIRLQAPEIALRTTFIVGFPGETEADVDSLEQFVGEGHFTHVGVFTYSQEAEAKSYHFDEQVPDDVKEARRKRVMERQQQVLAERASMVVGTTIPVLLENFHEESDLLLTARAEWQAPETDGEIIVNEIDDSIVNDDESFTPEPLLGKFAEVEIREVLGYDFVGKLVAIKD
ncbi:MAG: 30S ribosomal protein S12 methylthiotransferase RimO [Bdellovibrionota bacterium]